MRRRLQADGLRKITHTTHLDVRFSEVDSLSMVWHGHYIQYCEAARESFGRQYGLDYATMREYGVVAPVVAVQVYYHASARLDDRLEITAHFIEHQAPKLEIFYEIRRATDQLFLAEARTLQVCTSMQGELLITQPAMMTAFYERWGSLFQ